MIQTELYFDFRIINREDYSEQIKFFEKYRDFIKNPYGFDEIKSRQEFIRRIFILYSCGIAYSRTHENVKSIELFDIVIEKIKTKKDDFNIDLNKEHYYIDSLFEKGKAQYNLKNYSDSEKTFKVIMDTGFANYLHSNWYSYSRNARLFLNLNNWILYLVLFLMIFPDIALSLSPSTSFRLSIFSSILIIIYLLNPSGRLSDFITKNNVEKFNINLENRTDSIEYYTKKINQNPNDYVSLVERGISYNLKDDFENSLKDLNAALELDSNNSDALYYRAIALSRLDKVKEAIEDLNRLIDLNESDKAELFNNRGYSYMLLKDYEAALKDYNKAIELEPHYASYRFNRAYLYQDNGKNKEAIDDYNLVIELEPENYIAITNRGEAHYAIGDKKKALADFKKGKEFDYKEAIDNLEKLDFE
ncbi:tetratricopeptide repeat protein [Gaoshiqia sp. Z1-71]|uniref:tetratricopeptide repeat protein n=1 Tax=Gaoshiqia hydrogeniformans TaxID=3290090 RepID=UPI003BF8DC73